MDAKQQRQRRNNAATQQPRPRQIRYDEFQPTSIEWLEEPSSHLLHIDLPGFKKEDVKVQVDSSGKLTVRGKGKVTEGRYRLLEQEFDVPTDTIIEKISGKLEGGRLTLTIPKAEVPEGKGSPPSTIAARGVLTSEEAGKAEDADEEILGRYGREEECGYREFLRVKIMEKISGNRKIILVAAVAFTVGFCASRVIMKRSS